MRISKCSPEDLFGHLGKPLHFTGEISPNKYFDNLTEAERDDVVLFLRTVSMVAAEIDSTLSVLGVGSGADLAAKHGDLDFMICSEPKMQRMEFARSSIQKLRGTEGIFVQVSSKNHPIFFNSKIFC